MLSPNLVLIYAARPRVVLKYAGQLLFIAGILNTVPALVALLFAEWYVAAVCAGCGLPMAAIGGTLARLRATRSVQQNELLVITAFVFLVVGIVMAAPFWAMGIAPEDALFESISGLTTTGLSTLATVEDLGFVFLFTRAWMQWYGGLGFVVVSLALIVPAGVAARATLSAPEEAADMVSGARQHARTTAKVYVALTSVMFGVLLLTGLNARDALLYALAGISTGGYAAYDDSVASLNFLQQIGVQGFSALGALSLAAWYHVANKRRRHYFFDEEFRLFIALTAVVFVALVGILVFQADDSPLAAVKEASVLALSAQSTTGFSPVDAAYLPDGSKAVLIASMLVGGEFGSTAGGVKIIRVLILLKVLRVFLLRIGAPPNAVLEARFKGRKIAPRSVIDSAVLGTLFILTCFVVWLPFLFAEYDPLDALFESASALGTVGLSTGVTSPGLPLGLKLTLCGGMLLGRLEIIAWLVLLSPRSWFGRRKEAT